jgi:hypothetical protein
MISPTDLLHPSSAPHFETFQVFLIYCPKIYVHVYVLLMYNTEKTGCHMLLCRREPAGFWKASPAITTVFPPPLKHGSRILAWNRPRTPPCRLVITIDVIFRSHCYVKWHEITARSLNSGGLWNEFWGVWSRWNFRKGPNPKDRSSLINQKIVE